MNPPDITGSSVHSNTLLFDIIVECAIPQGIYVPSGITHHVILLDSLLFTREPIMSRDGTGMCYTTGYLNRYADGIAHLHTLSSEKYDIQATTNYN